MGQFEILLQDFYRIIDIFPNITICFANGYVFLGRPVRVDVTTASSIARFHNARPTVFLLFTVFTPTQYPSRPGQQRWNSRLSRSSAVHKNSANDDSESSE